QGRGRYRSGLEARKESGEAVVGTPSGGIRYQGRRTPDRSPVSEYGRMGAASHPYRKAGRISKKRSGIGDGAGCAEFGADFKHVVELLLHALPPTAILAEQAPRVFAGQLGPADQGRQFLGDGWFYRHGIVSPFRPGITIIAAAQMDLLTGIARIVVG